MTKRIAMALALVAGTAGVASAQSTATQTAQVTATVVQALTLSNTADLTIGVVAPGDGTVTIDPTTDANAAAFSLTGQANQAISVTYSVASTAGANTLAELGGATMAFTPAAAVDNDNTQAGSTTIASGGSTAIDGDSDKYFWVGGDLVVGAAQAAGSYTGVLTLTVAY